METPTPSGCGRTLRDFVCALRALFGVLRALFGVCDAGFLSVERRRRPVDGMWTTPECGFCSLQQHDTRFSNSQHFPKTDSEAFLLEERALWVCCTHHRPLPPSCWPVSHVHRGHQAGQSPDMGAGSLSQPNQRRWRATRRIAPTCHPAPHFLCSRVNNCWRPG